MKLIANMIWFLSKIRRSTRDVSNIWTNLNRQRVGKKTKWNRRQLSVHVFVPVIIIVWMRSNCKLIKTGDFYHRMESNKIKKPRRRRRRRCHRVDDRILTVALIRFSRLINEKDVDVKSETKRNLNGNPFDRTQLLVTKWCAAIERKKNTIFIFPAI